MPTQVYALNPGQTERLTVRWGLFWKNFTVLYAGQVLGQLTTGKELKQGAIFTLPDGRQVSARLLQKLSGERLELLLDGRPLEGSATHPQEQIRRGLGVLLFLAVVNALLGVVAEVFALELLLGLGLGWGSVVVGGVFWGLRWWAKAKTNPWAFYLAIALLVLDVIVVFVAAVNSPSGGTPTSGLLMRFFLGAILYQAAAGARAARLEPAQYAA